MNVSVILFAGLRDIVGQRVVRLELPEGATVGDLREKLSRQYPVIVPFLSTLVCAVNEEYVPSEHRLGEGDELALIPPISGGR